MLSRLQQRFLQLILTFVMKKLLTTLLLSGALLGTGFSEVKIHPEAKKCLEMEDINDSMVLLAAEFEKSRDNFHKTLGLLETGAKTESLKKALMEGISRIEKTLKLLEEKPSMPCMLYVIDLMDELQGTTASNLRVQLEINKYLYKPTGVKEYDDFVLAMTNLAELLLDNPELLNGEPSSEQEPIAQEEPVKESRKASSKEIL